MMRNYHLDPGYITIPHAARIVNGMLGTTDKKERKQQYVKILRGAKKGWFGGKMHGRRMFQVYRNDILQYGKELVEAEKYNLFTYDDLQLDDWRNHFPENVQAMHQIQVSQD